MTIGDITDYVERHKLYAFKTNQHRAVVTGAIHAHCEGLNDKLKYKSKFKLFRQVSGKMYELIENVDNEG